MNNLLRTIIDWSKISSGVVQWVIIAFLGWVAYAAIDGRLIDLLGGVSKSALKAAVDTKPDSDAAYRELLAGIRDHKVPGLSSVPSGLVIASTIECAKLPPEKEWTEYVAAQGRVILGANPNGTYGYENREFGSVGGEETVALTVEEMASHSHPAVVPYGWDVNGNGSVWRIDSGDGVPWGQHTGRIETENRGNNQPHNNMPPYIALYFCKKD